MASAKDSDSGKEILGEENCRGNGGFMEQFENYIIVDIGANLTSKKFARDLDSVIQRAKEAGKYPDTADTQMRREKT